MDATTAIVTIKGFPASKLEAARDLIARGYRRLVSAAIKAGQAAPVRPAIELVAERVILRCGTCKRMGGDADAWKHAPEGSLCRQWGSTPPCDPLHMGDGCTGQMSRRAVVDLEVTAGRPALAGWEFLAVVEPLTGGNLICQVPGASVVDGELAQWRTGAIGCDHCAKKRQRLETFIVRADGSDPSIPAGVYRQVGRNCLVDFLGGKSTAEILWSLDIEKAIRKIGDDDGDGFGGGPSTQTHDPVEFLGWAASSIRIVGWTSKAQAQANADRGGDGTSTASRTSYLISPPWGPTALAKWREDRKEFQPTEVDLTHAAAALAWAIGLPGSSDYERNLSLVARQPRLDPKHAGILASAITAYDRHMGQVAERVRTRTNPTAASAHLGKLGERLELVATVERIADVETDYGMLHIHTMRDAAGNALIWKTTSARLDVDAKLNVRGTVKRHSEYRGELQTELARCSTSEPKEPKPPRAPKERKARKAHTAAVSA